MQRSGKVPERGSTAPKNPAPRTNAGKANGAQRNNVRQIAARSDGSPTKSNVNKIQNVPVTRTNAKKTAQSNAARVGQNNPNVNGNPGGGKTRISASSGKRPLPMPTSNAAASAVSVPKQKKEPVEKIKPKKKKREYDPNRIRILSFEGKVDIPMLIITLVLLAFGITMMFSASHAYSYRDNEGDSYAYVTRQMTAAVIGLVGMMFVTLFDYRFLRRESKRLHITASHIFLFITIVMNFLCLFIGIEADGGQKRWLQLPLFGQFQPSDFLKVAVIVFMAYYVHKNSDKMRTLYGGVVKPLLIMVPVAASVVVQMHLSCLLIIFMIFAVTLFVGGVNMKEAVPIAIVGILAVYVVVSVVKVGYFQERIEFMDPLSDPGWRSYQNYQSALAIGSGGVWGKGFGNSSQKYYYLPEAQNDFVYAILVEEFGLVGGIFVMLLFIIFVMRGLYIARKAEDKFGCLMATGITFQIGMQALLNIAVNLCCIPNTGVSLPFFSYGGTALVLQLWEMGLLLSISKRAKVE
ncbi:MAG: putative lipid II flippase FtsW [Oscillospiraceae bacterium]|nr:putative lipid II flippase FtsW [Oscillospiraceae bacterium]